ncbi:protein of unknown function DUF302 [Magnetococcus marinus MC-1]|uniref:DUF302 domain-containing protein n=1 Tax=Magnetococcus marinus (strain ATCC BAA-1437 / JCM 17883 / MC-1) TaxID=156889 RepID=A0LE05_MAGMM|nr:DUF302 domain-containing protein [Magnetococcus marinus]ABK46198.1 protein of unknown function DUF302 [Magnetococcus marinus MC-1]
MLMRGWMQGLLVVLGLVSAVGVQAQGQMEMPNMQMPNMQMPNMQMPNMQMPGMPTMPMASNPRVQVPMGYGSPAGDISPALMQFDKIPGVINRGPVLQIPMPQGYSMEDVVFDLESGLAEHNLKVVAKQHLGKAIAERSGEPFPAYDIYHICNLTVGEKIIRAEPAFGAFLPCKVVLYQDPQSKRIWAVTYKPSFAMVYFPFMPEETKAAANQIGDHLFNILFGIASSNDQ